MTHELWARFLLFLGAAVVVPLGMCAIGNASSGVPTTRRVPFVVFSVAAVLLLGAAQLLSQGVAAAVISLPWLLVTCFIAIAGVAAAWRHRHGPLHQVVCACGLIYLAVGGAWVLVERAGLRPLNFDPAIVLLTGIHFHYAGFALPILAGLAIHRLPSASSAGIAIAVVASVPLVAMGITAAHLGYSPLVELVAAWSMSLAGLGVAWLYMRLALLPDTAPVPRQLWSLGAICLAAGMLLSLLYGTRSLVPAPWLDIPWMRAWHGTANALGFTIPALLGWRWHTDR